MKKFILLVLLGWVASVPVLGQTTPFWPDILAFKRQDSVQLPPQHPILFVGSSSFTKWTQVSEAFPGYVIINRGFGGSTLLDVIRYTYDIILPYKPKQVVIYAGENDLAYDSAVSPKEVALRFKTLYGMLRQNLPNARISFVSIKPSPVREKIQERVKAANNIIRAFLKNEKETAFIDIYPAMLDADGKMRESLYVGDRLHMKPEGYAIWQRIILPYLIK